MVNMLRRITLVLFMMLLCVWSGSGMANASDTSVAGAYDLSEYSNHEVLVVYEDGSHEVLSYASQTELAAGLQALAATDRVDFFQPNFAYTAASSLSNDEFFSEQWALYNDGSFTMIDQDNRFPVYDNPFDSPAAPGQWINPWPIGGRLPGGWFGWSVQSASGNAAAVSGVDINLEQAWQLYEGGGRETIIALIDTGVDTGHEDFSQEVFWVNEDEIAGNGRDDDGNGYVDDVNGWNFYHNSNDIYVGSEDNHGTHGAGSIAATADNGTGIAGIIGDGSVKVMVLKAMGGEDGIGKTESVIEAIQYAEANGAVICNMSIGTDSFDRALYQAMAASDMLFVVAAGNDGSNIDRYASYPTSFDLDNMISVANLQADGTLHYSSNYGSNNVDLAAPGSYILGLTADDTYSYMTGTSMSAPIVSAAAAMLYSSYDALSLADVKDLILENTQPLENLTDLVQSGGMLDAGAAMAAAATYVPNHTVSVSTLPFTDIAVDDSAYEAIAALYETGIMNGTSATTFSPDSGLTRAMAITMLGRLTGAEQQDTDTFGDVAANSWYSGYVGWAVEQGIVYGYGDGNFGPNDPVTAGQFGLMLERCGTALGISYDSGLTGNQALTRAEAAQALYDFSLIL